MSIISNICRATVESSDLNRPRSRASASQCRIIADRLGDDWLELLLHRAFDAVKAEPIPADLKRLIAELDRIQIPCAAE